MQRNRYAAQLYRCSSNGTHAHRDFWVRRPRGAWAGRARPGMDHATLISDVLGGTFSELPIKLAPPLLERLSEHKQISPPAQLSIEQQIALFSHLTRLLSHPSVLSLSQEERSALGAPWFQLVMSALETRTLALSDAAAELCQSLLPNFDVFREHFFDDYFSCLSSSLGFSQTTAQSSSHKLSQQQRIALHHAQMSTETTRQFGEVPQPTSS